MSTVALFLVGSDQVAVVVASMAGMIMCAFALGYSIGRRR